MQVQQKTNYKVWARFTKTFTKGVNRGIVVRESIPFVDIKTAESWVLGIEQASKTLNYTISEIYYDKI